MALPASAEQKRWSGGNRKVSESLIIGGREKNVFYALLLGFTGGPERPGRRMAVPGARGNWWQHSLWDGRGVRRPELGI